MTQTIYIEGIDEPIIPDKCCVRQSTFYGQPFIQDPMSKRWFPVKSIRYIEADV